MKIDYEPLSLAQHNLTEVACLIIQSAPELFQLMFGNDAISIVTALIERSQNRYSHRYIRVATINHQVVGIVILVTATGVNDQRDFSAVLSTGKRLWLWIVHLIVQRLVRHDYPASTLYIANLAIDPNYRNRGIGTQLLQHCIATAQAAATEIYISVDIANPRAQKLYQSLGFRVIETKTIGWGTFGVGSRVLRHSPIE